MFITRVYDNIPSATLVASAIVASNNASNANGKLKRRSGGDDGGQGRAANVQIWSDSDRFTDTTIDVLLIW